MTEVGLLEALAAVLSFAWLLSWRRWVTSSPPDAKGRSCFLCGGRPVLLSGAGALAAFLALFIANFLELLGPRRGEVWEICELSSLFKDTDVAFPLASDSNMRAYVDACRATFPGLDEAVRKRLRYAYAAGELASLAGDGRRLAVRQRDLPYVRAATCNENRFKRQDELVEEREAYIEAGIAPLKERRIPADDILAAFMRAETAVFDARELLPPHFFNTSLASLQRLHPEEAERMPVLVWPGWERAENERCVEWFRYYRQMAPEWGVRSVRCHIVRKVILPLLMRFSCPVPASNLADLVERSKIWHEEDIPFGAFRPPRNKRSRAAVKKYGERRLLRFASINLRRLPNFSRGFDLGRRLGISDQLLASHSLLWMGACPGAFHIDWHDNIYVQLTGKAVLLVMPANCSRINIDPAEGDTTLRDWSMRGAPKGKPRAPFFHITLRAGQGITIPSFAAHRVVSPHSGRVALNFFIEPKHGRMAWPGLAQHFFNRQDKQVAALRVLWVSSIRRLWETRRMSVFLHSRNNDFL